MGTATISPYSMQLFAITPEDEHTTRPPLDIPNLHHLDLNPEELQNFEQLLQHDFWRQTALGLSPPELLLLIRISQGHAMLDIEVELGTESNLADKLNLEYRGKGSRDLLRYRHAFHAVKEAMKPFLGDTISANNPNELIHTNVAHDINLLYQLTPQIPRKLPKNILVKLLGYKDGYEFSLTWFGRGTTEPKRLTADKSFNAIAKRLAAFWDQYAEDFKKSGRARPLSEREKTPSNVLDDLRFLNNTTIQAPIGIKAFINQQSGLFRIATKNFIIRDNAVRANTKFGFISEGWLKTNLAGLAKALNDKGVNVNEMASFKYFNELQIALPEGLVEHTKNSSNHSILDNVHLDLNRLYQLYPYQEAKIPGKEFSALLGYKEEYPFSSTWLARGRSFPKKPPESRPQKVLKRLPAFWNKYADDLARLGRPRPLSEKEPTEDNILSDLRFLLETKILVPIPFDTFRKQNRKYFTVPNRHFTMEGGSITQVMGHEPISPRWLQKNLAGLVKALNDKGVNLNEMAVHKYFEEFDIPLPEGLIEHPRGDANITADGISTTELSPDGTVLEVTVQAEGAEGSDKQTGPETTLNNNGSTLPVERLPGGAGGSDTSTSNVISPSAVDSTISGDSLTNTEMQADRNDSGGIGTLMRAGGGAEAPDNIVLVDPEQEQTRVLEQQIQQFAQWLSEHSGLTVDLESLEDTLGGETVSPPPVHHPSLDEVKEQIFPGGGFNAAGNRIRQLLEELNKPNPSPQVRDWRDNVLINPANPPEGLRDLQNPPLKSPQPDLVEAGNSVLDYLRRLGVVTVFPKAHPADRIGEVVTKSSENIATSSNALSDAYAELPASVKRLLSIDQYGQLSAEQRASVVTDYQALRSFIDTAFHPPIGTAEALALHSVRGSEQGSEPLSFYRYLKAPPFVQERLQEKVLEKYGWKLKQNLAQLKAKREARQHEKDLAQIKADTQASQQRTAGIIQQIEAKRLYHASLLKALRNDLAQVDAIVKAANASAITAAPTAQTEPQRQDTLERVLGQANDLIARTQHYAQQWGTPVQSVTESTMRDILKNIARIGALNKAGKAIAAEQVPILDASAYPEASFAKVRELGITTKELPLFITQQDPFFPGKPKALHMLANLPKPSDVHQARFVYLAVPSWLFDPQGLPVTQQNPQTQQLEGLPHRLPSSEQLRNIDWYFSLSFVKSPRIDGSNQRFAPLIKGTPNLHKLPSIKPLPLPSLR